MTPFNISPFYFKAENLVLRARSESVGFAEIVNKDRMVDTKAQRHRVKTKRLSLIISCNNYNIRKYRKVVIVVKNLVPLYPKGHKCLCALKYANLDAAA